MKTKETLVSGIAGTAFLMLFSYLVLMAEQEIFSEPERLGQLAHLLQAKLNEKQSQNLGWLGHFDVSMLFYVKLWRKKAAKRLINNLLPGGISGILAIAIWKTTFEMHPLTPKLNFKKNCSQLILAHLVFPLSAGIGRRIINGQKN